MPNQLAPITNIQSISQFHAIASVHVEIDLNEQGKEIYRQGSTKSGDEWVNLYALSNVGLSKLMNAAGIREVGSHRVDNREHPHICSWQFSAEYVQPDSTVLSYSSDYELDLRDYISVNGTTLRGARFEKLMVDERETIIFYENKQKIGNVSGAERSKKVDAYYASLPEVERKKYDDMAEAKALRVIVQMRQFIVQRAQTGAMERVIRKMLNLKSTYTLAELKEGFEVPRSRFDWDRVERVLGKDTSRDLQQIEAMKLLGISVEDLRQLKQLSAPSIQTATEASEIFDATKGDDEAVEVESTNESISGMVGRVYFIPLGRDVQLEDTVGIELLNDPLKTWFAENIYSKLKPRKHYNAHLNYHFGKESAQNLTWRELIVMKNKFVDGVEYPTEYKPTEEKPKKKVEGLEGELAEVGLSFILTEVKLDLTDKVVIDALRDLIDNVKQGIYKVGTDAERKEALEILGQVLH